jgi:hypothetical protein
MAYAATYQFAVPGRASAEALVEALAAFGFPQAGASPFQHPRPGCPGMLWEVVVVDEGPYPSGPAGYRQQEAAGRQVRAMAWDHGSFGLGIAYHGAGWPAPSLRRSGMEILRLNPGARPPVPPVRTVPAPPPGRLSLTPDSPVTTPRLDELAATGWSELTCACRPAAGIPALITRLACGHGKWDNDFTELCVMLVHQGTCYPATGPALIVLARLSAEGSLPAARRRDVYLELLWAAGRYQNDIISDADYAAAYGREPRAGRWSAETRDAVASATPALLARWPGEPTACRLALAALAATFPHLGEAAAAHVAQMAADYAGTQIGEYARLAHQLVTGDAPGALATASAIVGWNDHIGTEWIDDDFIPPGARALDILSQAVRAAAGKRDLS